MIKKIIHYSDLHLKLFKNSGCISPQFESLIQQVAEVIILVPGCIPLQFESLFQRAVRDK